jgi:hypothetical protein
MPHRLWPHLNPCHRQPPAPAPAARYCCQQPDLLLLLLLPVLLLLLLPVLLLLLVPRSSSV